jgi:hypothetical protein
VFLEIEPDRGSDLILAPLKKVQNICRTNDAVLLFVDFAEVQLWRKHMEFLHWVGEAPIMVEPVFPGEILIDAHYFDPRAHFQAWREEQKKWTASKPERAAKALARARELREEGVSYGEIADTLNAENILSSLLESPGPKTMWESS